MKKTVEALSDKSGYVNLPKRNYKVVGGLKFETCIFRLSSENRALLHAMAKRRNKSISAYLRGLVESDYCSFLKGGMQ